MSFEISHPLGVKHATQPWALELPARCARCDRKVGRAFMRLVDGVQHCSPCVTKMTHELRLTPVIQVPLSWAGDRASCRAHLATHQWAESSADELPRCSRCDCSIAGRVSEWPCGYEPPRALVWAEPKSSC